MPDYPSSFTRDTADNTQTATVSFVDYDGKKANVTLSDIGKTATEAEVNAWRAAMAKISNAGVYADGLEKYFEVSVREAITHIDPYAEVSDKGVFVFIKNDDDNNKRYVEVPAVYAHYVQAGGGLDDNDSDIQDVINTTEALLNARFATEATKFRFAYAYYSDRKGNSRPNPRRQFPVSRDPRNPAPAE